MSTANNGRARRVAHGQRSRMKAVVIRETGGPQVLQLEEIQRPEPGLGEVLVRVLAASVNPIDWKYRRGIRPPELPMVLGRDISGTVAVSRADGFTEGDEVFGTTASGGYAEFATAVSDAIAIKPQTVSHEQAASIPVAGLTAWQALFDRGRLKRGQTALIAGAAGGVGHFAVQFARRAETWVVGTGSSHNCDFVLGLGADEYVDYAQQDVVEAARDVDCVFDTVGGAITSSLVPTLREGGVLVTIAGAPPEEAARLRGARAELMMMHDDAEQLVRVADLVASGEVHVEISAELPLAEVGRAHEMSESGHTRGKIVLSLLPR